MYCDVPPCPAFATFCLLAPEAPVFSISSCKPRSVGLLKLHTQLACRARGLPSQSTSAREPACAFGKLYISLGISKLVLRCAPYSKFHECSPVDMHAFSAQESTFLWSRTRCNLRNWLEEGGWVSYGSLDQTNPACTSWCLAIKNANWMHTDTLHGLARNLLFWAQCLWAGPMIGLFTFQWFNVQLNWGILSGQVVCSQYGVQLCANSSQ